jgi:hypothetical protein
MVGIEPTVVLGAIRIEVERSDAMSVAASVANDLSAHQLLREAHQGGYRFPVQFGGFTAQIRFTDGGPEAAGLATVRAPRDVALEIDAGEAAEGWIRQELGSMAGHRWPSSYEEGDGRYGLTREDEEHPLGPLLRLQGDPYASSYRVKGGRISQVNRQMGPTRFSITIQAHTIVPDGRVLPVSFMVSYWSVENERLTRADAYTDQYAEVEGVLLPKSRRVVTADDSGFRVRELTLADHRLLAGSATEVATDAPRQGTRAG